MLTRSLRIAVMIIMAGPLLLAVAGDGVWMTRVPEKNRQRQNPFDSASNAVAAGAKLFRHNCASCHGDEGTGRDKHPNLHSDRIRNATPGELEWLLNNGSLRNGMPSWSRLPEPQRWQIVSFLKEMTR